jgi:low affinity Fe/Cu permease
MNENNLEFLDFLTIASFLLQVNQINNSNKHMQEIEDKLDYIIQKLNTLTNERNTQ